MLPEIAHHMSRQVVHFWVKQEKAGKLVGIAGCCPGVAHKQPGKRQGRGSRHAQRATPNSHELLKRPVEWALLIVQLLPACPTRVHLST